MLRSVLNWFGFGESNNDGHSPQKGDGQDHGHGHTHGIVDPSIPTTARGIWAIKWSFLVLFLTAAMQAVVVWLSGSVALLADTIHNVADASTAIPLWIAFVLARRAPSPRFTFGLGRVEDLAGVAIVLVILSSALVALWEAIERHPSGPNQQPARRRARRCRGISRQRDRRLSPHQDRPGDRKRSLDC